MSEPAIRRVADLLGMAYIRVYEVATFYTMFQLSPVGRKAHVQVCGTTPCMLMGAGDIIEVCRRRIAPHTHEPSADGDFSWEEVECLGACVNAPMVQIGKDTYEDLTTETFERILDDIAAGRSPKPGPQVDRQFSAPVGGPTTLTDPTLYAGDGAPAGESRPARRQGARVRRRRQGGPRLPPRRRRPPPQGPDARGAEGGGKHRPRRWQAAQGRRTLVEPEIVIGPPMAEVTNELIHEVLESIHDRLSAGEEGQREIRAEPIAIRTDRHALQREVNKLYREGAKLDDRLDRSERRLNFVGEPTA